MTFSLPFPPGPLILSERMKKSSIWRHSVVLTLFLSLFAVPILLGWGSRGHEIVNQVAFEMLPRDMPAFLRSRKAMEEIQYLGPEPDRWRSRAEPELNAEQAPEHFIDLELADLAAPGGLPANRFEFLRDLERARRRYPQLAEKLTPEKVGLLPWRANEMFERLKADMREYRMRMDERRPTYGVQQAILYDAGILGHYVADGSQPLHASINYDGWAETENPEGFTRERGIHRQFETTFVDANLHSDDVRPLVPENARLLHAPFQDFVAYLRDSNRQVPEVYRLYKEGALEVSGTAQSRNFTAERIAAGATMLRNMIYTAWVESGRAVPGEYGSGWERDSLHQKY